MSDIVIKAENLGKMYTIGHEAPNERYLALRDVLMQNARTLWNKTKDLARGKPIIQGDTMEEVWALKDVNFEIRRGEAVGIIGRNGAGKSTLLKVLSRITEPSAGRATVKGRVASLLEVGTGFHPELTGRENIYLNGAILGMSRREIKRKFDEIVSFAEVEKYLDTPVKRYSSGMYVRLAFAVAAHLEPEILLVDEVLAVGDLQFQKKCLGKMGDVALEGRTVLFVSHNMGAIQQLCSRALLLNEGSVILNDSVRTVVSNYFAVGLRQCGERVWPDMDQAPGGEVARLHAVRVLDLYGNVCTDFDVRDPISIEMEYWVLRDVAWLDASFNFSDDNGRLILASVDDSTDTPAGERKRTAGFHRSTCHIPPDFLNDGQFYVQAALTDERIVYTIQRNVVTFSVRDAMDPKGVRGNYRAPWPLAAVRPRLRWTTEHSPIESA